GNLLNRMDKVNHFCQMGYSVLVYDYRGFGLSSGTPDVEGAKKDADAALIFLKQTFNYANSEIVIYGESLGTGLAAELVRKADHPFAGLVLESGFASLKTQANRRFPGIGTLILKADLPTLTTISAYKGPLLIIHSRKDEVIPFSDSETLYNASPSAQKFFLALESGGHNDPVWNDPKYEEAWNFLKSCWKQEIEGQ
ncbi:MAG: alpha/beta hydrolase, partial [Candidatus Rifleibacteriota bacterium]